MLNKRFLQTTSISLLFFFFSVSLSHAQFSTRTQLLGGASGGAAGGGPPSIAGQPIAPSEITISGSANAPELRTDSTGKIVPGPAPIITATITTSPLTIPATNYSSYSGTVVTGVVNTDVVNLANPASPIGSGYEYTVINGGATTFTVLGRTVTVGQSLTVTWDGTAWRLPVDGSTAVAPSQPLLASDAAGNVIAATTPVPQSLGGTGQTSLPLSAAALATDATGAIIAGAANPTVAISKPIAATDASGNIIGATLPITQAQGGTGQTSLPVSAAALATDATGAIIAGAANPTVTASQPLAATDASGNIIGATTPIPQSLGGTGQTSLPANAAALATDATGAIIAGAANPTVASSKLVAATDASGNVIGATLPLPQSVGGTGVTALPVSAAALATDATGAIIAGAPNPTIVASTPLLASDASGNVIAATTPVPQSLGGTGQTSLPANAAALATDASGAIIAGAANPTVVPSQSIAATDASGNIIGATLPITQAQGGTGQTSLPVSAAALATDATGAIIAGAANPTVAASQPLAATDASGNIIGATTPVPQSLGGTGQTSLPVNAAALATDASGAIIAGAANPTVAVSQPVAATDASGNVIGATLPLGFSSGGIGTTAIANKLIPYSDGTKLTAETGFEYDATTDTLKAVNMQTTGVVNAVSLATDSTGKIISGSSGAMAVNTVSTNTTLTAWSQTIKGDATTAAVTITLPTAVGFIGQSIEVSRADNTNNPLCVKGSGTQTINGSTNLVCIYGQYESIVLRSDGANALIVADNRNSAGAGRSFVFRRANSLAENTNVANNGALSFDTLESSFGTDISYDATSNRFTLKAGKTYRIVTNYSIAAGSGFVRTQVFNVSTGLLFGVTGQVDTVNLGASEAAVVFTPSSDTTIEVRNISGSSKSFGQDVAGNTIYPRVYIEVISMPATVANIGDYGYYTWASNEAITTSPYNVTGPVLRSGNIASASGVFSLVAGKTYELEFAPRLFWTADGSTQFAWVDSVTNVQISNSIQGNLAEGTSLANSNIANQHIMKLIYTPTANQTVRIRAVQSNNNASIDSVYSYAKITQIGATGVTVPISAGVLGTDANGNFVAGTAGAPGATAVSIVAVSASLSTWGQTIKGDATTGTVTITLPTAVGFAGQSVEVSRTDNSSNVVCVAGNSTQTINGSTSPVCLYNQYDSIVVRSDGANSIVVADNRASAGSNKSFLFAKATVAQNISAANTVVNFGSVDASFGSDITLDTATGIFILKALKTYRLQATIPYGSVNQEFKWYNNTANAYFGTASKLSNSSEGETTVSNAIITPTVDTSVTFRAVSVSSSGSVGFISGDRNLVSNAYIEVISAPAVVTNTMDYVYAGSSVDQSITAVNQTIAISTVFSGNIPLSSNNFTLSAGKTYRLIYTPGAQRSNLNADARWYSITNSAFIVSSPSSLLYSQSSTNYNPSADIEFVYTPTVNEVIQLRISNFVAAGTLGDSSRKSFSNVVIQQIGSSAASVPANTPVLGTDANGNFIAGTVPTATVEYGYAYGFGLGQSITTTISAVNVSHQSGNLSFNSTNKTYALSANKTYRVQAGVRGDLTGNTFRVRLRDTTNNVTLSPNNGNLSSNNWLAQRATSLNSRDNGTVSAIYTPTANGTVGIEVFSDTGVATLEDAYLEIVQIGTTATILPTNNVAFGANLKGWWKLNESGPTDTAIDSSPSALNLPATVTTNLVLSGGIGRTARANNSATNGTGRLTAGTPCLTTNTNFGMAVWLNPLSIPLLGVAYNVGNGTSNGAGIGVSNGGLGSGGTVVVQLPNVGTITSAISISATQWVHVVFTRGTGNSLIYVNGVLVTSSPLVPVAPTTATSLFYNGNTSHGQWRGSIQDAICVNREITALEAAKLASTEPIATIQ